MKRIRRWLSIFIVVLLCIALCGCNRLDEMQARHAVWQDDGTFLWSGALYRPLPFQSYGLNGSRFCETIRLTDEDVPVLLSDRYGSSFYADEEGTFVYGYVDTDPYGRSACVFCREDMYDTVAADLKDLETLDGLCYDYYDQEDHTRKTYYLTVEQQQALYSIMQFGYTVTFDWDYIYSADLYYHDPYDIYRQEAWSVVSAGGDYYLMQGAPYVSDIGWLVPEDYEVIVKSIISVGYQAEHVREKVSFYE